MFSPYQQDQFDRLVRAQESLAASAERTAEALEKLNANLEACLRGRHGTDLKTIEVTNV